MRFDYDWSGRIFNDYSRIIVKTVRILTFARWEFRRFSDGNFVVGSVESTEIFANLRYEIDIQQQSERKLEFVLSERAVLNAKFQ